MNTHLYMCNVHVLNSSSLHSTSFTEADNNGRKHTQKIILTKNNSQTQWKMNGKYFHCLTTYGRCFFSLRDVLFVCLGVWFCISVLKQFNMYNANVDSVDTSFEFVAVRFNCIFNQPHRIHTERQCINKQHRGHWRSNHFRSWFCIRSDLAVHESEWCIAGNESENGEERERERKKITHAEFSNMLSLNIKLKLTL